MTVNLMTQVFVDEPKGPRLTVKLGVNSTSRVVTSDTAIEKVSPPQASQVPVPAPVQHENGVFAPMHSALLPPVAVVDKRKTPGSMLSPTQTDAEQSPQDGVCRMLLSVTFPRFCGKVETFVIDKFTGTPVWPNCTDSG